MAAPVERMEDKCMTSKENTRGGNVGKDGVRFMGKMDSKKGKEVLKRKEGTSERKR